MDFEKARNTLEKLLKNSDNLESTYLPDKYKHEIKHLITGTHLTFRYILFTALLAKTTQKTIHMRSLQASSELEGAYDARSLCHKVVVPFDKELLYGKLGNSNEPFLNKPARFRSIELSNPVRAGSDKESLIALHNLLEELNSKSEKTINEALIYSFKLVLERPNKKIPNKENVITLKGEHSSSLILDKYNTFINKSIEGSTPVAALGSILRTIYKSKYEIKVHPANQSGASSREVSDIDVILPNKQIYGIEVKDKPFTDSDILHAATKVKDKGYMKLVFAFGPNSNTSSKKCYQKLKKIKTPIEDISFLNITEFSNNMLSLFDFSLRKETVYNLYCILQEMRAKDQAISFFKELFNYMETS